MHMHVFTRLATTGSIQGVCLPRVVAFPDCCISLRWWFAEDTSIRIACSTASASSSRNGAASDVASIHTTNTIADTSRSFMIRLVSTIFCHLATAVVINSTTAGKREFSLFIGDAAVQGELFD